MSTVAVSGMPTRGLLRILGLAFGVATVVGGVVGMGILRTPGTIAGLLASTPLIYAVWLVGGIYALLAVNSYAELATAVPRAGGPYVYVRRAFGNYLGFVTGWCDLANLTASMAFMAVACSEFLALLLPWVAGHESVVAAALIVTLAAVNSLGLKTGSALQQLLTLLKVLLLLALVGAAFAYTGVTSGPALPAYSSATATGVAGIIVALQLVVGVYSGYNGACYFSEELTDPGRTLPRSMFVGALLVIALFLFINAALLRILTPAALSASTLPAADALATLYGPVARTTVDFVAAASALAVLHATVLLAPRVLYGMSRDGLFTQSGMYVTRSGVPLAAMWMATGIAVAFTQMGNFVFLFALVTVICVFLDLLCALALFVLRRREPNLQRPYRAFGYPWVPGIVVVTCTALLIACILANPKPSLAAVLVMAAAVPLFRFVCPARARPGGYELATTSSNHQEPRAE
jgi:basic amino acid/polyamine antiporter, APA family